MSVASFRLGFAFAACYLALSATAFAAPVNGTIEEVSTEDKTVTVKLAGKSEESKTFTLAPNVAILIDGKKGKLEDITEGQTVVVVVNSSDLVTKLTVKTPKGGNAKPKTSTSKTPKMTRAEDRSTMDEEDSWPQFRGPNRDDISMEKGLLDQWPEEGPKLAWKQKGLGEGYSSVSMAHGILYTMGNQGDDEMVLAMDLAKGSPLWSTKTGGRAGVSRWGTGKWSSRNANHRR